VFDWLTDAQIIQLIWVFWLPVCIAHTITYIVVNRNDIVWSMWIFVVPPLNWGIIAGISWAFVQFKWSQSLLWLIFLIFIIAISTLTSELIMDEDSIWGSGHKGFWMTLKKEIRESLIYPWFFALIVGTISIVNFGL
jgi:hypothetical protein